MTATSQTLLQASFVHLCEPHAPRDRKALLGGCVELAWMVGGGGHAKSVTASTSTAVDASDVYLVGTAARSDERANGSANFGTGFPWISKLKLYDSLKSWSCHNVSINESSHQ